MNVYPIEHYDYSNQRAGFLLRKHIQLPSLCHGAFGENFTVSGLDETTVCIGDVYQVGSCIVEVSQPRQPCWKLARKFQQPKLPFWIQQTGRTGWYLRVLHEGHVQSLDDFILVNRKNPGWTLQKTNTLMYSPRKSTIEIESLLKCKELSESWRDTFYKLLIDSE